MSIIALAFTMCTPLICNTYLIDTSEDLSKAECNAQYVEHSNTFTLARNKGSVKEWGWTFAIPDADKSISYAFDCVVIQDDELP